jgi:Sigma-70 region 2
MARIRPDTTPADQLEALHSVGNVGSLPDDRLRDIFLSRDDPAAAETAFSALVDRHGPMVLSVYQRVLQNPHDAHDAFQATFLVTIDGVIRDRDTGRPNSRANSLLN